MNCDWIVNQPSRFPLCEKKNTIIYVNYNKKKVLQSR